MAGMQGLIKNVRTTPASAFGKGVATSATMLALGDVLCQAIQHKSVGSLRHSWDRKRTGRFALVGLTLHGPTFFTGFRAVDGFWGPGKGIGEVLKKTAAVQLIVFPPFLATFFYYLRRLEGKSHQTGVQSIKDNFWTAFSAGSIYWPVVNVVNFALMPADKRMLLTSSAALVYNTFLSWVNATKKDGVKMVKQATK
ncbi:hypothetical protein WJX73_009814 [Symbiochloris irregularis]|uniref:Uncharacterized protein n=1 Tax=Symbiochloris irregularis TaxID=706552 RepID=A0AAW1PHW0_9CHLO